MELQPRRNRLLESLPDAALDELLRLATPVHVPRGAVIRRQGDRPTWVHLPLDGLVSVVGRDGDGNGVDVAVVGRDGVVDAHAAIVDAPMPTEALQQIPGLALRLDAGSFRASVARLPGLRFAIDIYLAALFVEVAQGSACNRLHDLQERVARCLLMTADHVGADAFALTHELLALMVGSSRPKVSERLGVMAESGSIGLGRNEIKLIDRSAVERLACDCHRAISHARAVIFQGFDRVDA